MLFKNKDFSFLHYIKHALIVVVCIAGFLFPGISSAWFAENEGESMPFLHRTISSDRSFSDTYVLLYNVDGQKSELSIFPDSKSCFYIAADRIDIDIPLNVLSKNAVNPGESIDRLLAVNLRMIKILDEYSELDKRAEQLLKDLSIPYLHNAIQKKRNQFTSSIRQQSVSGRKKKLKQDFDNVIKNQPYNVNMAEKVQKTITVLSRLENKERSVSLTNVDPPPQSPDPAPAQEFDRINRTSEVSVTNRSNNELPWIFKFVLKVFQYCIDHKVEMILYTVLALFFIALIPLKGRE